MTKEIKDFYPTDMSKWDEEVAKFIADIESSGAIIIAGEPIEKLTVQVIGRRFTVER